jgi:hypothetical protein
MLTPEETKVLCFLNRRHYSNLDTLMHTCLPGAPAEVGKRVIANLEWLNNLTVFYSKHGDPVALQITEKGMALARTLAGRQSG